MATGNQQNINYYKSPIQVEEDTWVDDWAHWVDNHIPIYYVEGLDPKSTHNKGSWVEYEWNFTRGIYAIRNPLTLQDTIYSWLRANDLHLSTYYVKEALARLKTKRLVPIEEFDPYDPQYPHVNCLDGLWFPKTKDLQPHDPDVKCLNQIPCHLLYTPSMHPDPIIRDQENFAILVQLEKQMPCWLSMRKFYRFEMDIIERYTQMVLFQDIKHKMQVYVVGGSNTGKSTVGSVLTEIFSTVASYQPLAEIGEKWGLMPLIGKKVNFDMDSGMGKISNLGLGRLKAIVGDPGKLISVPIIYQGARNVVFSPFFYTFANQLQRLPINVNREAWGKRALVLIMDHTFQDDENFEAAILREKDAIFTYLCLKPYLPISRKEFGGFSEFTKRNLRIWDIWSDPVRKIIMECFKRSTEIDSIYTLEDVEKFVIEVMSDRQLDPSFNLERSIRTTFKRMGAKEVKRTVNGVKHKCYMGIDLIEDHIPEGINYIFKVEAPAEEKKRKVKSTAPPPNQTVIVAPTVAIPPPEFPEDMFEPLWSDKGNPIYDHIVAMTKDCPSEPLEFQDVYEPLVPQGIEKKDIREYWQTLQEKGVVIWREKPKSGYFFVGEIK